MTRADQRFISEFTSSSFAKADDITPGQATKSTIKNVRKIEFQQSGDVKPALDFYDLDKTLVLNKTQTRSLVELFGNDPGQWIGKEINLMAVPSSFQGKKTILITAADGAPGHMTTPAGQPEGPPPAFPDSEPPSLQGNPTTEVQFE